ncbi:toxin-antitoxin system HicB family antitoxin [Amycolatopsis cihanbeyliensis]|uniref:HicB-like protein involved in pilus formation n=1 Tax=Amycolatopsis cihanbeyliensis TaxID=1128664 RepID=A0A542CT89_AMYCI|nr:toxin-antitoxin system HicB family antitoxin [Amycolatopsis cihanbeyliensis]TQI94025.1 HicB-like protein involved in pilus formation [Amycolatopsis cihanbeyliensis]
MDLTPYLSTLREDLATAASAGDEQTRRAATVLAAALEPAARLALMNALADLAAEVTAELPDHVVDVRLDGRDVRVVVTGTGDHQDDTAERETSPPPPPPIDGRDISRITLRLFEQLKGQAEQAASAQGVSLNTFVSQAVQGALQGKGQRQHQHGERHRQGGGNSDSRLHGWVQG